MTISSSVVTMKMICLISTILDTVTRMMKRISCPFTPTP